MIKYVLLFLYAVEFCWCLMFSEKRWTNYDSNNLEDWSNEVSINGVYFSTREKQPIAFYDYGEVDSCQIVIPLDDDDDESVAPSVSRKCPIQEKQRNDLWIDPRNWESSDVNEATPHVERIPCAGDRVYFKNLTNLFVVLPDRPVHIYRLGYTRKGDRTTEYYYRPFRLYWKLFRSSSPGDITINEYLYQYNFNTTAQTEDFMKHFVVTGNKDLFDVLKVNDRICDDRKSCECGTLQFLDEICSLIAEDCSSKPNCPLPVKPVGHCCDICGSVLTVYPDQETFVYRKFKLQVEQFLKDVSFSYLNLKLHISVLSENAYQIVITANEGYDDDLHHLTVELQQFLKLKTKWNLGIIDVTYLSSGSLYNARLWTTPARVFLAVFIISAFVVAILFVYNNRKSPTIEKYVLFFKKPLISDKFEIKSENLRFNNANAKYSQLNDSETDRKDEIIDKIEDPVEIQTDSEHTDQPPLVEVL